MHKCFKVQWQASCHCCKAQGGNLALDGMHRGVGCTVSFCMSFCMGCTVSFCMGWDAQCRSSTEGWGCTEGMRPCLFCDHAAFSFSAHSQCECHSHDQPKKSFLRPGVLGGLVMDSIQDPIKHFSWMKRDPVMGFATVLRTKPQVAQNHLQSSLLVHASGPKTNSEYLTSWQCAFPATLMHINCQ